MVVVAAFLRRDFRINISYRVSFAFQSVSIVLQLFRPLLLPQPRGGQRQVRRSPESQRRLLRVRRRGTCPAHDRAGQPFLAFYKLEKSKRQGRWRR